MMYYCVKTSKYALKFREVYNEGLEEKWKCQFSWAIYSIPNYGKIMGKEEGGRGACFVKKQTDQSLQNRVLQSWGNSSR